jgi:hypothetical protein
MPWWNPFDWFSTDDNEDDDEDEGWEDDDSDEEYDAYKDAGEIMEIANGSDFDEWDRKGQIPKTNPPRQNPPDTGPLKRKWF